MLPMSSSHFINPQTLMNMNMLSGEHERRTDLGEKSEVELLNLLHQQEKLLRNKNFVVKLPDGGEKLLKSVNKIKKRLAELNTTTTTQSSSKGNEADIDSDLAGSEESHKKEESTSGAVNDNRAASSADLQIIERGLDRLSIHEGPFYDVVKKANARPKKSKFLLHRQAAKAKSAKSPHASKDPSSVHKEGHIASSVASTAKTAAPSSSAHSRPAVEIPLDESRNLITSQQILVKEQQTSLAAERLAARYGHGDAGLSFAPVRPATRTCWRERSDFDVDSDDDEGFRYVGGMIDDLSDLDDVD